MSSGFPGGGGGPEFYGGGRSMIHGGPGTVINVGSNNNNNPQPTYRNQIPGIFLDQIGNRVAAGHGFAGKRTLADFQAAQQQHHQQQQQQQQPFYNQAALNAFLLRSVKPRNHQNHLQSPSPVIDLTSLNDMSFSQRYGLPVLRSQTTQQQSDLGLFGGIRMGFGSGNDNNNYMTLTGVPCIEPVQRNRVHESENNNNMLNSLRELEKQLLDDDDDESDAQGGGGGDDDVSVITNSNSDWIQNLVTPNPNPNPNPYPVTSSSPSSSSSSSSPSTASTTTTKASVCSRQTVMEIATAIAEGKTEIASELLARVSETPSLRRNSEEKLVDFMVTALRYRINNNNPAERLASPATELYGKEHLLSTQLLYELSPCFKLGFMAANLAILDSAGNNDEGVMNLHVIDFDIGEGGQYVNLLHALSTRRNGINQGQKQSTKTPVVKITVVTNSEGFVVGDGGEEKLKAVGDLLSQLGDRLGISVSFYVVASLRLGDLSRESLGCEPDEPLAVNLAFKLYRVPDESVCTENPRDELLRRVKGLKPRVVTIVEQEMNSNTAPFLGRVSESCACYGALLESVESTVPSSNLDRGKVEEGIGRKLINAVACEGIDRIERCEVFGKWRMRMSMAGFELMQSSEKIAESMKSRLSNGKRVHSGFTVKEDNGGVCFGWMGRTIAVASAWR
ncbi:PREDICTED: scarecrow-like protein 8 [Camelina sativa]|uniref:Scarecrow-like protein 8 n=1 Tax=Camelina sativa TaxID=90675 RepID=A0ABM0UL64_CAMSA|nr:PREDICTED: scarecrow-like protein 8 [Camelina sativa]